MSEKLNSLWIGCTGRNRAAIAWSLIVVALAFAYAYVWLPVTRERDRLVANMPELRIAVRELERDVLELERLSAARHPLARDIKSALQQSALANGMRPAPLEIMIQADRKARITLPPGRAAQWLTWIEQLQSEHRVRLESVRIQRLGEGDVARLDSVFILPQ